MRVAILCVPLLLIAARPTPPAPKNGQELIRAMHDRYAGQWYKTLSFTQNNTATDTAGKETHSVWKEYANLPGQLRIDFLPADSGQGYLFRADSLYIFGHDSLRRAAPFLHPLMILGFDVYATPAETTITKLTKLGFDLSKIHEDTWDGHAAYVVGVDKGDTRHKQFWIDKDRLLFLRIVEPGQRDTTVLQDTRFEDYRAIGKAWLSARVRFLINGKPNWLEEYIEIRTGDPLAAALWDPKQFGSARPK
ncbi:MAG TPA: hypothetical protein VJS20_01930 [Gemmatimonadales bacterium]|nr:hypothetical protein [Gemmatimonadales bacterium]